MKKSLKIIEWNINQRSGHNAYNHDDSIPQLVSDEIKEQSADIVVLTEFYKRYKWEEFINDTFDGYNVFYSMNPRSQNDNDCYKK